jgi:hypothetical protein
MSQSSLELPSTSNAVLIDAFSFDNLVYRLYNVYDLDLLEDLCGLLVQVVLRDRVYLVPTDEKDLSDAALRPWLDEGTAFILKQRRSGRKILSEWRRPRAWRDVGEAKSLLEAAARTNLPIFAGRSTYHAIESIAPRRIEHAICDILTHHDLLTHYMRLEDKAIQTLLKYRLVKPYYWQFRVPPLPLEILRRCKSIADITSATLEVRYEHSSLRRQFGELSGIISDIRTHPQRKMREIRKLESSLSAISRVADGHTLITCANSGGYFLNSVVGGAQGVYGAASGDVTGGIKGGLEFLKSGAAIAQSALSDRFRAWRLEPLHRAFDRYMRTSDHDMLGHVSRLFGRTGIVSYIGLRNCWTSSCPSRAK